jgi:uracil phosphoribosyltransferase
MIVDGAIASGSTVMAIIDRLQRIAPEFHIFSVHATYEGVWAISSLAASCGVKVAITVGHATAGLNDHFYAVDSTGRQQVGDLGDTICGEPYP